MAKDLFSKQSSGYARFRPTYPAALFDWLASVAPARDHAVDVGTGNGQSAVELAERFARVTALDPSQNQLDHATPHARVTYRRAPAEATGVEASGADLVTASQAFHWFDHARFFEEVRRILRPDGVVAVWCYGLALITPEVDAVVHELYEGYLGTSWEPERRLVEDGYRSVALPAGWRELEAPSFEIQATWTLDHLIGYVETWSALETYRRTRGEDPMRVIKPKLEAAWGEMKGRAGRWPLSVRAARR
ncbi:MAG TPA: class I SAM-dependent methyltransferase [Polyangia bacterium]|nr:class I SAM-dependent methyltransferase [Polyangia bacterium]